jgi:hypothetical protein
VRQVALLDRGRHQDRAGVGLLDEASDPGERLPPLIAQLRDSRIDQPRGRDSSFSSFAP